MKTLIFVFFLILCVNSNAQMPSNRTYLELNVGVADLPEYGDALFPGVSFLVGYQYYISEHAFLDIQGGLAFPSIITAKTGVGVKANGIGCSVGVRIFPTMGYAQIHFPTQNGQLNISAEASPFANYSNYRSTLSIEAKSIFTIGYQWNLGKGKIKQKEE